MKILSHFMELYQKQKKCLHIYRSINIYIKLGICWGSLLLTSCNNKSNYINSNEVISMAEKVDTVVYDMIQKVEEQNASSSWFWYRYKINGKCGALNEDKEIIIPALYESICYGIFPNLFTVVTDKKIWGAYTKEGMELIPTSRGYTGMIREELSNERFYYCVAKGEYYGACDEDGNEFIEPLYSYITYTDKGNDENDIDYSSFGVKDEKEEKLLYMYMNEINKVVRFPTPIWRKKYICKKYYSKSENRWINSDEISYDVSKYDNHLIIGLFRYDCNSKRNGYSCYERKNDDGYFYIKENDNLIFETENSIYEFIERMQVSSNQSLEQSASVSSNNQNQNNFSNNVPYVTSNKNQNDSYDNKVNTYQPDCPHCHGFGKCWTCNGRKLVLNPLTNEYMKCPNCTDGICSFCDGTGKKQ